MLAKSAAPHSLEVQQAFPLLQELEDRGGHVSPLWVLVRMPLAKHLPEFLHPLFLRLDVLQHSKLGQNLLLGLGDLWRLLPCRRLRARGCSCSCRTGFRTCGAACTSTSLARGFSIRGPWLLLFVATRAGARPAGGRSRLSRPRSRLWLLLLFTSSGRFVIFLTIFLVIIFSINCGFSILVIAFPSILALTLTSAP